MEQQYTSCVNPATGEVFGSIAVDTIDFLRERIALAKAAQKEWAARSFAERKAALLRVRDYIAANADDIADCISRATGKTRVDALSTEVLPSAMAINWYAKSAKRVLKRKRVAPGNILLFNKWSYIDRAPYGVVGIISPWNYPFGIPFHEIAMALMAGNAVILKVASQTLDVGKCIERCIAAGRLPDGLFTHINLPGSAAGDAFIDSGIDKIFFTGSVEVGKYLMKKASEKLLPLSLELGGNDAMIVLDDANIPKAAAGALWAGLSNAGQSCAGVERLYIDTKIYSPFIAELKRQFAKLRQGVDTDFNVDIGSLTTVRQVETVREHLRDAMEKGASATFGEAPHTRNNTGSFHPPVLLEHATDEMLTMREETFGPLIAIASFQTVDEAIDKTNNSSLGLTASVWSQNHARAKAVANRLETGAVTINDHLMSHGLAETPWGGWKNSGTGRTHGHLGLEAMTQPRVVIDDVMPGLQKNMWWHPHNREVYEGLRGALHFLYHSSLPLRVSGLWSMLTLYIKCFRKIRA